MTKINKIIESKWMKGLVILVALMLAGIGGAFITVTVQPSVNNGEARVTVEGSIELSEEQVPAVIEDDKGEVVEEVPTVEEVDGGKFEDETTGVSAVEGDYADLGWAETYDVSSPTAFKNATFGKCIYAGNRFGAQCVSLARVFWWSYANRDVSTCGTGMAKGMMNCAEQNAGDDFEIHWSGDIRKIQAGDWLVLNGGAYGHVAMALGGYNNGYVAVLGENQGGKACAKGGAATNIINLNVAKNLIGFYRPKAYIQKEPEPTPAPTPAPVNSEQISYTVKKGDQLGYILRGLGYTGQLWGEDGMAEQIADDNGIADKNLIYPGQIIKISKAKIGA